MRFGSVLAKKCCLPHPCGRGGGDSALMALSQAGFYASFRYCPQFLMPIACIYDEKHFIGNIHSILADNAGLFRNYGNATRHEDRMERYERGV